MITSEFWFECLWGRYVLFLGSVLFLALVFKKMKHLILGADIMKKN